MDDAILRRIRRCLALSKSSNPNEAATALRQAQAMMRQHDLTEADVGGIEVDSDVVKTREGYGACAFLNQLASLMRDAFGVVAVMERNPGVANRANIRYIGPRGRTTTAVYAHKVVMRALEQAWDDHLRHHPWDKRDGGKRTAFRLGWLTAVRGRIEAIGFTDEERGAVRAHMKRQFGDLPAAKMPTLKFDAAKQRVAVAGLQAAQDFQLHRPMDADAQPERPAIGHERG